MDILARAFRTLAEERPAVAYAALADAVRTAVEEKDAEPRDSTICGQDIADFTRELTIKAPDGRDLPPISIRVYHTGYYAACVVVSDHGEGVEMISLPDSGFEIGIVAWPHGGGTRHEVVAVD